MLSRIIDFALDNRWLVLTAVVGLIVCGVYVLQGLPIDAFPDLTNNQVVVITECPAMSPGEVDQLVTYPIESALVGMPRVETVRSASMLGLSTVTMIFDDSVNNYLARQLVSERLQEVRSRLPGGVQPQIGPMATAFGEVFQYTLQNKNKSQMDIKTFQDWTLRYALRSIPGVSEVNAWGGQTKHYSVEVDPVALQRYGLTIRDVIDRLQENNANFGGGYIEHTDQRYTVRAIGRLANPDDIGNIVLKAREGVAVLLRDVGQVKAEPILRYGAALDEMNEAVSATVIGLKGENGRDLISRVKARLASFQLPEGYKMNVFYDQSEIINATLATVRKNLLEAGLLVAAVLLIFLGDVRAALIVAVMIPLSMLFGFIGMAVFGISANLMSLGAIDFGMIVDGSVVMIENAVHSLETPGGRKKSILDSVRLASKDVARPILFGVAIIIAVYLPILTLQGLEGRMFRPMAITVCSALVGSLILALVAVPTLASLFLRVRKGHGQDKHGWFSHVRHGYTHTLRFALRFRIAFVVVALGCMAAALVSLRYIGTEFMPKLDEGSILITTRKLPGVSLSESIAISKEVTRAIRSFPEVTALVTKLGRPDVATEAMGIYESDSYLKLAPKEDWKCCHSKPELIDKLDAALKHIPGLVYIFTQPMEMRMDETVTGIRGDVAIKIFGDDLDTLGILGKQVYNTVSAIPGAVEPYMEVTTGVPEAQIRLDRAALARYGLNVSDVQQLIEKTVGGQPVTEMIEGRARFGIAVRLPESFRSDPDMLGRLRLRGGNGELVNLSQVASIQTVSGPELISRENTQRRLAVQVNVRGTDVGSFVRIAQDKVRQNIKLPEGYTIDWGGQFENQTRANRRLMIVLPISIAIIFGLLFATFHSLRHAALILLNVPFAMIGGIAALWLRDMNLTLSASIGFIALFGVAVLNGIVLVSRINTLRDEGHAVSISILEGAANRLRPVLMTALVASLGFIPMALSTATGAEIQRPLATVVIGGLVTSTLLTLYILPILYPWFSRKDAPTAVSIAHDHEHPRA
jgi:cobalt-zinc-cadmium resistance protein CzcA